MRRRLLAEDAALVNCKECGLWASPFCSGPVDTDGDFKREIMVIGEAPGESEDTANRPFVGKSGKLLDQWLSKMSLSRDDVLITNICQCRPSGNRTPTQQEMRCCSPLLASRLAFLRPRIVIPLGKTAIQYFFGYGIERIGEYVGTASWRRSYWIIPFYHPSFVLRQGGKHPKVYEWQQLVRTKLVETERMVKLHAPTL